MGDKPILFIGGHWDGEYKLVDKPIIRVPKPLKDEVHKAFHSNLYDYPSKAIEIEEDVYSCVSFMILGKRIDFMVYDQLLANEQGINSEDMYLNSVFYDLSYDNYRRKIRKINKEFALQILGHYKEKSGIFQKFGRWLDKIFGHKF